MLDRLVGYRISPILAPRAAGPVGGPGAVGRGPPDRRAGAEIRAFQPVEYWSVDVRLHAEQGRSRSSPG